LSIPNETVNLKTSTKLLLTYYTSLLLINKANYLSKILLIF